MELRRANKTIALLCLALQLLIAALPLANAVVCVAPGHVALEMAGECAGAPAPADQSVAPHCTDYGLAQSEAVPPDLRLPQPKRSAPALVVSTLAPRIAILPRLLPAAVADGIPSRTANLRSLRSVILVV